MIGSFITNSLPPHATVSLARPEDRSVRSLLTVAGLRVVDTFESGDRWVALDNTARPVQRDMFSFVAATLGRRGKVIVLLAADSLTGVLGAMNGSGLEPKKLGVLYSSSRARAVQAVMIAQRAKPGGLRVFCLGDISATSSTC